HPRSYHSLLRRPPTCPRFPYTTLFRSGWFSPLRAALDAYVDRAEQAVNGLVRVRLYEGVCEIVTSTLSTTQTFDAEPAEIAENRSEEHTSELQSRFDLVCRLLLEKKKK